MNTIKKNITNRLLAGTAVLVIVLLYSYLDVHSIFFPKCPFYLLSHFYCPGCGSQRALSALLHKDIVSAMHNNLLMVLCLPLLISMAARYFFFGSYKNDLLFYRPWFAKLVLVIVISFWVLRNIPFYPFCILAPLD